MSTYNKKNKPAFARPYTEYADSQKGMSLRDYFVAKAMAAFIIAYKPITNFDLEQIAITAGVMADLMIENQTDEPHTY